MMGLNLLDVAFVSLFPFTNGPLWNPTNMTDAPLLWYIGDNIVDTNNAPVSLWTNNGSSSFDLNQSTSAQKPVLNTNFLNSHSVVLFDPTVTSRRLALASGSANITFLRAYCFTVVKPRAYPSYAFESGYAAANIFGNGHGGFTADLSIGFGNYTPDGTNRFVTWSEKSGNGYNINCGPMGSSLDQINTNWLIVDSVTDNIPSSNQVYSATNIYASVPSTGSDFINIHDSFMGHEPNFGSPINAYVAEFLLYSNTVVSSNILKIEGYYAWKYNLQTNLPLAHPYRYFKPTP